jgi:hypothetical protein
MSARTATPLQADKAVRAPAEHGPFHVPPGDFARPGLVDRAFVERSVAAFRKDPNARYTWRKLTAEDSLREDMAERLESIRAIDRLYGDELNEWAATTIEQLWLEYFTAEAILRELEGRAGVSSS